MNRFLALIVAGILVWFSAPVLAAVEKENPQMDAILKKRAEEYIARNPRKVEPLDTEMLATRVKTKPCDSEDVVGGMWKRVYFYENPPRSRNRAARIWKHYYLTLTADKFYAFVRSSRNITDKGRVQKITSPDTRRGPEKKYILKSEEKSAEIIFMNGNDAVIRQSCAIAVKPAHKIAAGDMILQGYTKNGKSFVFELYRRWF